MSNKKRTLTEISQASTTPSRRDPLTSHLSRITPWRTGLRPRSVRSVRHVEAKAVLPESARGILRRLARITAPTTKRRTSTPTNTTVNKENYRPTDEDVEDETKIKRPRLNFQIEESLEEGDSDLPVAPTPSALLENLSSDDRHPTETFHNMRNEPFETGTREPPSSLLPHSEPGLPASDEESEDDGYTTFLTEHGRRAVSEEATKMSRYSFGSIHMSGFGSELEIRRESDRPDKLLASEAAKDKRRSTDTTMGYNDLILGGETEDLRNLRASLSSDDSGIVHSFHQLNENEDTFRLDVPDNFEENFTVHQRVEQRDNIIDATPVLSDNGSVNDDEHAGHPPLDKEQELLVDQSTSVKTKVRDCKKLKMNKLGNMVPSIPSSLIKRIVHESCRMSKKRKISLGKDHMKALEQATEWYFEQVSEDLGVYASHGKRKKRIDESDVLLLMRRQRLLQKDGELRQMAKEWLTSKDFEQLDLPDRP